MTKKNPHFLNPSHEKQTPNTNLTKITNNLTQIFVCMRIFGEFMEIFVLYTCFCRRFHNSQALSFQWVEALFPMDGSIISKVWKQGF